jgi:hypothetical protein
VTVARVHSSTIVSEQKRRCLRVCGFDGVCLTGRRDDPHLVGGFTEVTIRINVAAVAAVSAASSEGVTQWSEHGRSSFSPPL